MPMPISISVPTTAFRFFTVYGPWGRPGHGAVQVRRCASSTAGRSRSTAKAGWSRDFTYIDDLVEGIVRLMGVAPAEDNRAEEIDTLSRHAPFRVVNIGGGQPVELMRFVETVEAAVGRPAIRTMLPMQQGDVPRTFASLRIF